jgi:hypothetical protein
MSLGQRIYWFYRSMYYRLYLWSKWRNGNAFHHAEAGLMLSALIVLNIFALCVLYIIVMGDASAFPRISKSTAGLVGGCFYIAHIAFLLRNGRSKKIIREFSNETPHQARRRNFGAAAYAIGSVVSLLGPVFAWALFS